MVVFALSNHVTAQAAVAGDAGSQDAARRPNVVVLFADDVGWGDFHYRRDKLEWPNVDRLMRDGICFTDAYTASPTCSPSRASLLTGQHPARLRIVRHIPRGADRGGREYSMHRADPAHIPSRNWLPLDAMTIGGALKPLGYQTAFIGKWHLGPEPYFPIHNGFDEQHGVTPFGQPASYSAPFWKNFETYENVPAGKYLDDQLTDDAVEFIERQDAGQPFLLTMFYYGAHSPWQGRKDLVQRLEKKGLRGGELHQAALCAAIDESLGRIRETLLRLDLADNTAVIFCGDQGSLFKKSPMRGGKQLGTALYEGSARVPLIVSWPKSVAPGRTSGEPVITTDLLPTFLEMAGGDASAFPNLDGVSLLPLLNGDKTSLGREAIFLYRSYDDQYAAVRSGDFKLIAYRSGRAELFNVATDLAEANDLAAKEPDLTRKLQAKLAAWEIKMNIATPTSASLKTNLNKESK